MLPYVNINCNLFENRKSLKFKFKMTIVNLPGNLVSHMAYIFPLKAIKVTLNLNVGKYIIC